MNPKPRRPWLPLVCLILGLLPACRALPPPVVRECRTGQVWAESTIEAKRFAQLLDEYAPKVHALLPGTQTGEVHLWVQEELRYYRHRHYGHSTHGIAIPGGPPFQINVRRDTVSPAWIVNHELTHAFLGPDWETLPGLLEEGLCDYVATQVAPECGPFVRMDRLVEANPYGEGFRFTLSFAQWDRLRGHTVDRLFVDVNSKNPDRLDIAEVLGRPSLGVHQRVPGGYGVGYVMVFRIIENVGLHGLHELCLRAKQFGHDCIPVEWTFRAAGYEPGANLQAPLLAACGQAELRELARILAEIIADVILAALNPDEDPIAQIEERKAHIELRPGVALPLADIQAVRDALRAKWKSKPTDKPPSKSGAPTG